MYGNVNWPSLVRAAHYRVLWVLDRAAGYRDTVELSGVLHCRRGDAQAEIDRFRSISRGHAVFELQIRSYDEVFLPRCSECGEYPDGQYQAFLSWFGVADYIRSYPGWLVTCECTVFCSRHNGNDS